METSEALDFDGPAAVQRWLAGAPLHIFGYASLIWRPDFKHVASQNARLRGFLRRLWQSSPDHRGTKLLPGRAATLVRADAVHPSLLLPGEGAEAQVRGVLYEVAAADADVVLAELFYRERAGYSCVPLDVTLEAAEAAEGPFSTRKAITFTSTPSNDGWAGPPALPLSSPAAPLPHDVSPTGGAGASSPDAAARPCWCIPCVGRIVGTSVGASGTNIEYVERLLAAVRSVGGDEYLEQVFCVANETRAAAAPQST